MLQKCNKYALQLEKHQLSFMKAAATKGKIDSMQS